MPIVQWTDFSGAQQAIISGNNALQPLTPQQAQTVTNARPFLTENGVEYFNFESSGSGTYGVDPNVDFPNTSASQASQQYISSGGQTTAGGAATQTGNITKTGNYTFTQKGSQAGTSALSMGALLSVNLPTAAAAIAPVAGVALGAGLYSLNPDLWGKISRALLPFCYEGTELLPVVADEAGVTYFPKEAIDAVTAELMDISYDTASSPDTSVDYSKWISPYPFRYAITDSWSITSAKGVVGIYKSSSPIRIVGELGRMISENSSTTGGFNFASESPATITAYDSSGNILDTNDLEGNAQSGYIGNWYAGSALSGLDYAVSMTIPTITVTNSPDAPYPLWLRIANMMLHGTQEKVFPVGTSTWTGVQYPLNPDGIGVVTRISPDGQLVTTNPYYPITMPVGPPGATNNPTEFPDLTKNPEVNPAINPWLTPSPSKETYPDGTQESKPAPIENPVPDYTPNLDPNSDPSQQPEQQPDPDADPAGKKPGNTGNAPPAQIPIIPVLPSAATGLLHVYNPTQSQIDAFGSWLWTTFSGDLIDTISKLFNDPMDAVIGLHELYATPSVSGSSTIRAGFLDSNVPSNLVGNRYTEINCGSVVVQEFYQNYLDYSPYTKCYIYLPFIGIVPVLADDIIGNAVNVTYHVDSYTGCCIAVVTVAREGYSSTVYQFEGNCAVEIPITSGYQSTLMGALIGVGATALTGNPHAGIAAANMGRASLGKNDVSHSGSFGSSYGAMGAKVPYIIVKRPTQKSVVNYNQEYGFPAHKRVTIGACTGYLRAREVHVISPTATDDEKSRIEELLKDGVFVK